MRTWHRARQSDNALIPLPIVESSVHAPGADSDRVLVFGSGIAVGWGVRSHDLALPGHLARALSARTGRGTDVYVVADARITVHNAAQRLASIAVHRYDALVVVLGMSEALGLASVSKWRKQLSVFLGQIPNAGAVDVILPGVPSLRSIDGYGTRLGMLAERHSKRFNQATAEVCADSARATFVWLSPTLEDPSDKGRPSENYHAWGAEIAERTAPLLNASRAIGAYVAHDVVKSEMERHASVSRLNILHTAPEARFDRIVDHARMVFHTGGAALSFIDGNTIWYKSIVGTMLPSNELTTSFTKDTISQRGVFTVPDTQASARYQRLTQVTGEPWVRFWAGFPIEDENGTRVGTLSVFDSKPRHPTADDNLAVLRQFALMVQHELRQTRRTPDNTK
jgi:GAF domain-containing protein